MRTVLFFTLILLLFTPKALAMGGMNNAEPSGSAEFPVSGSPQLEEGDLPPPRPYEPDASQTRETQSTWGRTRPLIDLGMDQAQPLFENSDADANTQTYVFQRNNTYKIHLREYMNTAIVLPEEEKIETISLADNADFKYRLIPDLPRNTFRTIEVWGEHPDTDTNMRIYGQTGRIYSFYLRVYPVQASVAPDFTVFIQEGPPEFNPKVLPPIFKPKAQQASNDALVYHPKKVMEPSGPDSGRASPTPDTPHPEYEVSNPHSRLAPLQIFDDGRCTYFRYDLSDWRGERLPALFKVVEGYDVPVRTKMDAQGLIAEELSNRWTIRLGEAYICVRKKSGQPTGIPSPPMSARVKKMQNPDNKPSLFQTNI